MGYQGVRDMVRILDMTTDYIFSNSIFFLYYHDMKLLILFVCLISTATAFEGVITYQMTAPGMTESAADLKVTIKGAKTKFEVLEKNKVMSPKISAVMFDFAAKKVLLAGFKPRAALSEVPFEIPEADKKSIPQPEEITETGKKKEILGYIAKEHETYFYVNNKRLPVKAWYAIGTSAPEFQNHVHHLLKWDERYYYNFFFKMDKPRSIALELQYTDNRGRTYHYLCTKIEKSKVADSQLVLSFE
jgi:hypothetical protein